MILQKWREIESKFNIDMPPPTRWVSQDPMQYKISSLVHNQSHHCPQSVLDPVPHIFQRLVVLDLWLRGYVYSCLMQVHVNEYTHTDSCLSHGIWLEYCFSFRLLWAPDAQIIKKANTWWKQQICTELLGTQFFPPDYSGHKVFLIFANKSLAWVWGWVLGWFWGFFFRKKKSCYVPQLSSSVSFCNCSVTWDSTQITQDKLFSL